MKSFFAGLISLSFLAIPCMAQQQSDAKGSVTLGGNVSAAAGGTCVEVEIGGERTPTLDCLNRALKQSVDRVQPIGNLPPLGATSPAVQTGGFNEAALSEQYGQNLGKSVIPFRPPAPVYGTPVR